MIKRRMSDSTRGRFGKGQSLCKIHCGSSREDAAVSEGMPTSSTPVVTRPPLRKQTLLILCVGHWRLLTKVMGCVDFVAFTTRVSRKIQIKILKLKGKDRLDWIDQSYF